jgi:ribulose-phosphate 3-epimerase
MSLAPEFDKIIVAASMLACDFSDVGGEAKRAETAGADWLHMDVMDGHFVDNISFGPAFVAAARKSSGLPVDVHLMITRPDHYFPRFVEFADNITVHVEAQHDVAKTLAAIRDAGCSAGLSLNPATPFETVEPYLGMIDLLLVMTVVPGFGGQAFMTETMKKVEAAAEYRHRHNLAYHIEVDGGIQSSTAPVAIASGANVLVAGTAVFGKTDMAEAIRALR